VLMTMKQKRIHSSANQEVQNGWTIPHYSQTWIQASRNDGTVWECVQMGSAGIYGWQQTLFQWKSSLCYVNILRSVWTSPCIVKCEPSIREIPTNNHHLCWIY
jgi:hypothetical protein